MHSLSNPQFGGDRDNRRSPPSPTPLDLSSPTSPSNGPISPMYSPSSPQLDYGGDRQSPTSPTSPVYSPATSSPIHRTANRTGLHSRGRWEHSSSSQEFVYRNTYKTWKDGDMMRLEDENLLAACSGPFLANYRPQAQSSKLLNLPLELQHEIFRNVGRGDLKALSQTCVVLRAAMLPLIMEHVILSANSPRLHLVVQTLEATISNSKEAAGMIRNMEIPNDDTNSDILARLLPFTAKLNSLVYGYIIYERPEGPDIIDARGIGRLLAPVRHSLTHLKITYKLELNECDCGANACVDGWCCLKDMVALKKLEMTFSILLGSSADKAPKLAHVLPPGIVQLRIESDPWELDPAHWNHKQRFGVFAEFVRDRSWEQFTPSLKLLNYNMDGLREYWATETAATETALVELIRENGLEFDCHSNNRDPSANHPIQ